MTYVHPEMIPTIKFGKHQLSHLDKTLRKKKNFSLVTGTLKMYSFKNFVYSYYSVSYIYHVSYHIPDWKWKWSRSVVSDSLRSQGP